MYGGDVWLALEICRQSPYLFLWNDFELGKCICGNQQLFLQLFMVLIASSQLPYWYKCPRMGPRFGPVRISWTTSGRRDQSFCVLTLIYMEARTNPPREMLVVRQLRAQLG